MIAKLLVICCACFGICVLGCSGVLLFLAWNSEPLPTTTEAIAALVADEQTGLALLCAAAEIEPAQLRIIASHEGDLFEQPQNRFSLVTREQHVIAVCIRNQNFVSTPELNSFPMLESIDLQGCGMQTWPAMDKLTNLRKVNFSAQPIGDPPPGFLSTSIETMRLRETRIQNLQSISSLSRLKHLDISRTAIESIDDLTNLELDAIDAAETRIRLLPKRIPTLGAWVIDLDHTPVTNPPGFSATWPFGSWIANHGLSELVWQGQVEGKATALNCLVPKIEQVCIIELPRNTDPNLGVVMIEASCAGGQGRIWLEEPPDLFASPWMTQHKVKGFGLMRRSGFVSTEVKPGTIYRLRGKFRLRTENRYYEMPAGNRDRAFQPPDWCHYGLYVEPTGPLISTLKLKITAVGE